MVTLIGEKDQPSLLVSRFDQADCVPVTPNGSAKRKRSQFDDDEVHVMATDAQVISTTSSNSGMVDLFADLRRVKVPRHNVGVVPTRESLVTTSQCISDSIPLIPEMVRTILSPVHDGCGIGPIQQLLKLRQENLCQQTYHHQGSILKCPLQACALRYQIHKKNMDPQMLTQGGLHTTSPLTGRHQTYNAGRNYNIPLSPGVWIFPPKDKSKRALHASCGRKGLHSKSYTTNPPLEENPLVAGCAVPSKVCAQNLSGTNPQILKGCWTFSQACFRSSQDIASTHRHMSVNLEVPGNVKSCELNNELMPPMPIRTPRNSGNNSSDTSLRFDSLLRAAEMASLL